MSNPSLDNLPQKVFWSPFPYSMGIELLEFEPGRAVLRLPFSDHLRQSFGLLHGGAIFTLADTASGRAAHSVQPEGRRCVTLEMKINYIGSVQDEDCLAEGRVVHQNETSLVVAATVKSASGKLIAKTLATFAVLKIEAE
ncbi:MAG TPA: PaaI family thioesterase [Blastocatellia bacterium]|nr:PaaI family thioesterase [Blastocatellia bacterium]